MENTLWVKEKNTPPHSGQEKKNKKTPHAQQRLFNSRAKLANSICRSNATSKAVSGSSRPPSVRKEAAGQTGRWILNFPEAAGG